MKRLNEQHDELIELGTVSAETKGPVGPPIDDRQGFALAGLSDD